MLARASSTLNVLRCFDAVFQAFHARIERWREEVTVCRKSTNNQQRTEGRRRCDKKRVINLTNVRLVFRSRSLDPEEPSEMYHHAERRGEQGGEAADKFVGAERGRGGSRAVSVPFEHRPLHRRQTRDQCAGWRSDREHANRVDSLCCRCRSQHDSSFGTCDHDYTDLPSLFVLQADRRTRRRRAEGTSEFFPPPCKCAGNLI